MMSFIPLAVATVIYCELESLRDTPYVLFSDANFGDIFDARLRSTTGWCCYVFGCLISWHSRRQSITAKCTLEAELIAAATCSVEKVAGATYLWSSCRFSMPPPVPLLLDNNAALLNANYPRTNAAIKHTDISAFVTPKVKTKNIARIRCYWIPIDYNCADHFSKLRKSVLFRRLTKFLVSNKYDKIEDVSQTANYLVIRNDDTARELSLYLVDDNHAYPEPP